MTLAKYVYCLQALEENHEGSEKEFDLEESKEENNIADKEQGFIKESLVCDLNSNNADLTKEALLNQLQEVTVSCKDATFKILGLSLATINIFISLTITTITIKLFLTYEKNK